MKNNLFRQFVLGSPDNLPAHRVGGARARKNSFAKKFASPSDGVAEEGCGRNSAAPEQNKIEASPAALLVKSRGQQKSFLFLLEEKIRRAQKKSRENFFAGWRALASGEVAGRIL